MSLLKAIESAREYAGVVRERGYNDARAHQLRDEIDHFAGRWVDGKFVLPEAIVRVMSGEVLPTSEYFR